MSDLGELVIIESPYAGDITGNTEYARRCMKDCFDKGEFPFASHLLYTQHGILDDTIPEERKLGINAGLAWGEHATKTVVYMDRGVTAGMLKGIKRAENCGRPIEMRTLYKEH